MKVRNKENLMPSYLKRIFMQSHLPRKVRYIKEAEASQLTNNSLKEVGSILKEAREEKRLSLKEIKDKTCIPLHHIIAIEAGEREKLPEDLYLAGFIKRYAKSLGLNEQLISEIYIKGNKKENKNYEEKDFDMLFDNNTEAEHETNVFKFKPKTHSVKNKGLEKSFFKVYHLYLLLGLCLFLIALYLMIKTLTPPTKTPQFASGIVLEQEGNDSVTTEEEQAVLEELANESLTHEETLNSYESELNTIEETKTEVIPQKLQETKPKQEVTKPVVKSEIKKAEVKSIKPKTIPVKKAVKLITTTPKPVNKAKPIEAKTIITKPITQQAKPILEKKPEVVQIQASNKIAVKRLNIQEENPNIRQQTQVIKENNSGTHTRTQVNDEIMLRPLRR